MSAKEKDYERKRKTYAFTLSDETDRRLDEIAKRWETSRSAVLERLIRDEAEGRGRR